MSEKDRFDEITDDVTIDVPEGYIKIDDAAIEESIRYIRLQKEHAIDAEDYEEAARWRDAEKQMLASKALGGLVKTD